MAEKKSKKLIITVSEEMYAWIKKMSDEKSVTMATIVKMAIDAWREEKQKLKL